MILRHNVIIYYMDKNRPSEAHLNFVNMLFLYSCTIIYIFTFDTCYSCIPVLLYIFSHLTFDTCSFNFCIASRYNMSYYCKLFSTEKSLTLQGMVTITKCYGQALLYTMHVTHKNHKLP